MLDNFPKLATDYFVENKELLNSKEMALFLVRPDGVPIYHQANFPMEVNESSIGALLGGVWQAAKALSTFIPADDQSGGFRLSFDTCSKGVYILPIEVRGEEYFLGIIYYNETNPGMVKLHMRNFVLKFHDYIENVLISKNTSPEVALDEAEEEVLFKNITDDEMDQLFSF